MVTVLCFAFAFTATAAFAALTMSATEVSSDGALTVTGAAASTWSTSAGDLTITGGGALALSSTTSSAASLDSGTTGAVNIGTGSTAKTVTVGNTTGASTLSLKSGSGGTVVTSADDNSLALGPNGATTPIFQVDSSTASAVAGLKVTGAATGGTVAVAAIDSGAGNNLTVNAKGAGTIGIGSVSTGAVTITPATTVTGALTVNGATVTLGNAVADGVILNGRVSTSSAAGAALTLDSTYLFGEGQELRYKVTDWTGVGDSFKAMYVRAENGVDASTKGVYGMEVYATANDTFDTGNLQGILSYAYLKGTGAKTVGPAYGIHGELSFDASQSTQTITTEASAGFFRITGGVADTFTKLHGVIIRAGDMDGQSRTYGNAILVEDGPESGAITWTRGLKLNAASTADIELQNAATITNSAAGKIVLGGLSSTQTSGDLIGLSLSPSQGADTTGEVFGAQIKPRVAAGFNAATVNGLGIDSEVKSGDGVLSSDLRGINLYMGATGTGTIGGNIVGLRARLESAINPTGHAVLLLPVDNEGAQDWDGLIKFDAALGTHGMTTNSDKTGNAKSGTIKVIGNDGTVYHIQLYAD